ncbi:MAG TPA: hypothetical protein PLP34_03555, partial [Chitinophagaceae bacterium]|nr:hypothetical protein [Chitinophagaceae bacterium]
MGIIKRQGLKTSIVSYGGVLLGVIFFIFVFPHLVDAKYLGLIGLLQNLMYVFATLPALGIPHILLRFFPGWKETPMLRSFNSFALLSIALSSVLFIVLYILFRDLIIRQYQHQSALFIPYYYAIIPLVIVFAYNQYFELYSMVHLRVALPAFLREILTRVLLILSVFLFAFHWLSESQFVVALIFSYLLSFIVLAMYTRHSHDFGLDHPRHFWKKSTERKEALQYGAYMLLLNGFTNIHNFLDGIMVNLAKNHDWRFGIFSPENQPIQRHFAGIMEKYFEAP